MDLAARTQYLKGIKDLTMRCQTKLESLVTSIGWSVDSLNKNVSDSSCSNDAATQDGALKPETKEGNTQLEDFEKRYNDLLSGLPTHQKKEQEKSEAEALAELLEFERNAKRRRISYKNKVHTKNKSHTEVLRELVREQMEVLKEISGEDTKEEKSVEKPDENEDSSVGLIQLSFTKGNPHRVWEKIGLMVENTSTDDKRQPLKPDDGSCDVRSRRYSRERPNKFYDKDDIRSWRCHDDRDSGRSKDRRRDKYERNDSKNRDADRRRFKEERRSPVHRDDYGRHRHKSDKRRSRSPEK